MATTMAASHGIERKCVSCGLSYRYPSARQFTCQNCGAVQSWEPTREQDLPIAHLAAMDPGEPMMPSAISLIAVAAMLNHASSDGLRQLHDRLAILSLVHEANRWQVTEPEHHDLVRRLLSGAGLKG